MRPHRADPRARRARAARAIRAIGSRSSTASSSTTARTSSRPCCAARSRATATSSSASSASSRSAATPRCSPRRAPWSGRCCRAASRGTTAASRRASCSLFDDKPTAKRALYVLRTAATGRYLLARGELVTDVARLADFVPAEIDELIAIKRTGERSSSSAAHAAAWRAPPRRRDRRRRRGWPTSVLPLEPPPEAIAALDAWLRDVRQAPLVARRAPRMQASGIRASDRKRAEGVGWWWIGPVRRCERTAPVEYDVLELRAVVQAALWSAAASARRSWSTWLSCGGCPQRVTVHRPSAPTFAFAYEHERWRSGYPTSTRGSCAARGVSNIEIALRVSSSHG